MGAIVERPAKTVVKPFARLGLALGIGMFVGIEREPALWGGPVTAERYAVIARL